MRSSRIFTIAFSLVTILALAACGGPATPPTPDATAVQATIDAAAVFAMQTLAVQLTGTAIAQPTDTATPTLEPTATFTATIEPSPTIPPPTPTNTRIPATNTPAYTATPKNYGCEVTSVSPASGAKLNTGQDFDLKWTVKNTGTKNWEVGTLDLKYESGYKFQTVADVFDINTLVEAGKEITLIVDALMPTTAGTYTATWKLIGSNGLVCTLPVNLTAVAP
jgi:hypothetical protein